MKDLRPGDDIRSLSLGLGIAAIVILAWATTLGFSVFGRDWRTASVTASAALFLLQTFLFTGLFITAHDSMHGLVAPGRKSLNDAVGTLALFLYAGFDFKRLLREHHRHHAHPATVGEDPDFHDGKHSSVMAWYFRFLWEYRSLRPFIFFTVVHSFVIRVLDFPWQNFAFGWALPAIASSFQLFFFGTYLPHRETARGYNDQRAESNDYPEWLSLLTCYHFGYHYEHHRWPFVPWWRLARARRRSLESRPVGQSREVTS